ncbi:MAG: ABC transporter ATP-binding protein [Desulfobacterales bacterium]
MLLLGSIGAGLICDGLFFLVSGYRKTWAMVLGVGLYRFENVSYTYPFQTHKALDGISFAVRAGEAVLCTGASGCGKSTLVRMLNGLIPHYFRGNMQGRVRVCGAGTEMCLIHEISRHVGMLFQEPEQQFFALSVADEMAFALECRAMAPKQIKAKIRAEADRFRLTHLMAASVFDLSEGEKQKVALASILAQSPSVLVLDEPSANLDPAATEELAGILADLKQQGMTLFIVDHRLYWLNDLVDRVIVLENARICETGPFSILEKRTVRNRYGLRKTHFRRASDALISAGQTDGEGFRIENLSFAFKNRPPVFESAAAFLPKGSIIANAIKKLSESGTCVLVISHDLELISIACTHVLCLPLERQTADSAVRGQVMGF